MDKNPNLNSKERLKSLLSGCETGDFSAQNLYQMEQDIEQQMEKFDMDKREQTAQVLEDLSKIVITT